MSRTPIQVPIELKEELGELKKELHSSSLPDVISQLLAERNKNAVYRKEEHKNKEAEKQRQQREDVHLGEERKNRLIEFQRNIGLASESEAIDFLLEVFETTPQISMNAFKAYIRIREN
ncbi:hypothetical protein J6TS7_32340 [Paenibacillus dendritiformis]|uniref:hypothetical protein n=1 Tax=Paenibacillus TaxID=44249 RepID=UPI001B19D90E|nr:hypothetical protein [Paenibacillus dendritiformis]GIO79624.1 hypothetical protein J6TS7_32340 [Paenibacillus dendritiformis]